VTRPLVCAIALAAALPALAATQKFKSGVDVVRVDALVTANRKPVSGLNPADFELRDNGVTQSILSADIEPLPLSVIFVLDISGSVAGSKMEHLRQGIDLIVKDLHPDDRAALVTFSHRIWLRTPLMSDFKALQSMLSSAEAAGGTSLRDAVFSALAISDVQDSRPLLVVFSDGLDNMSWMSADIVEKAARRANAVVYGVAVAAGTKMIGMDTAPGGWRRMVSVPEYSKGQTDFLDAVASATGGRVLKADTTGNLPAAFDEVLREFRTRYVITYTPRGVEAPGWHTIAVKVTSRMVDVKARAGYQK
jgi:VWFA-related protein